MQHARPKQDHPRIPFDHRMPKSANPFIFNINNARARTCAQHFAVCTLAFSPRDVNDRQRPPELGVFLTCSSNLLMMAWTHSTGLCAAMLRRMRAPQCLLSITFAIAISAPDSPPYAPNTSKTAPENNAGGGEGGGGRRGVWFSFSLQAHSTTPPWHTTGSLNPPLARSSLAVEHAE